MTSTSKSKKPPRFVQHLLEIKKSNNRSALAELRASLTPGKELLAARHVLPWLGDSVGYKHENAAFLIAGLFAMHPESSVGRNFGETMHRISKAQGERSSAEQRFIALLSTNREDIRYHLRQAVQLARSCEISVNWAQLYQDLCNWEHPDRFVQRNWAREFWGRSLEEEHQEKE